MNLLYQFPSPVIFAHRGASIDAPENTLSAFELAVAQKADGIELDTKLTGDGYVVVVHDRSVDRTTNGHGMVNKMTLSAIRELDAGYSFPSNENKTSIPTLDEVCESVGKKTYINIELTNYASPHDNLPIKVAEIIRHHSLEERVLFSSFIQLDLLRIKKILPEIPIALLCARGLPGLPARSFMGKIASPHVIHPYFTDVSTTFIRHQKMNNRRVHVWTVNNDNDVQKMLDFKVDGIITDNPQHVLQVIGRQ